VKYGFCNCRKLWGTKGYGLLRVCVMKEYSALSLCVPSNHLNRAVCSQDIVCGSSICIFSFLCLRPEGRVPPRTYWKISPTAILKSGSIEREKKRNTQFLFTTHSCLCLYFSPSQSTTSILFTYAKATAPHRERSSFQLKMLPKSISPTS